ncbi:glycosyl hydrolase [Micromonospora sp. DR5-3]|uniref:glycosyl hydrolase n=1 Tax=unclassified Micromonospora TaxID=2617518 RepID=UPI0011D4427F|nr:MULTISPECIES: glycosyl hydrolase [unclassified Micromonospora]MCW3820485.1 glycosyl hydrolase [Micromonospora sp. DR5-3]TYC20894.1 glycosyl hydrolase [Micromonospora sp. MP36]
MVVGQRRRGGVGRAAVAGFAALVTVAAGVPAYADDRPVKRPKPVAGVHAGQAGIKTFASQEAAARMAPYGAVAAGEYSDALADLKGLRGTDSRWYEVTDKAYDADDPNYRDPEFSNSGGGAGVVAGRVTGLAAGNGWTFAGGANGGVFRKKLGNGGTWQPISDGILALSTGDLVYDAKADTLWYATGEANTGATSYAGAGVYRLRKASTARGFSQADRVGGDELESRSINQLKFDGAGWVYAATSRGLWRHSTDPKRHSERWQLLFLPNPASDTDITRPYDNIINDVLIQPGTHGKTVLINAAWRSGAAYNGYYLSTSGGQPGSFTRVTLTGDINNADVGNAEFATSADGEHLYLVQSSPAGLAAGASALAGVYHSTNGVLGPWTRIADSVKLENSGSAIGAFMDYPPGVQAWYNNFVEVDATNPRHVYVGLEEVYETEDAGATWKTIGPYWNFGFPCYDPSIPSGGCPSTTHADQHSIAISGGTVLVGNDGGVYSRPLAPAASKEDSARHATDWTNHNATLRTLQYYSVGTGRDPNGRGWAVAGGLQDNGGSLLRGGARKMVSPFGGDGGDIIVNSRNGCQILDEYVFLALWLTTNCGQSDGSTRAIFDVTVPDINARFTAPFRAIRGSKNVRDGASERWVAGGNSFWRHDLAFAYTPAEAAADDANGWQPLYTLDSTGARLIVGMDAVADPAAPADPAKDTYLAAWCGQANCNSAGFTRGVATNWGGSWTELDMTGLPNRYPNAVTFDPNDPTNSTIYLVFNGFNRRFIEGPGAGVKHVYRGQLTKTATGVSVAWTDLSVGFPDVPATDVVVVGDKLVVGTDLGVLVADRRATPDRITWRRVGANSGASKYALPLTAVFDLHVSGDGNLYAATHGRGIWKTPLKSL